jgi:outer membrane protein assembly factor BamA
MSVELTGSELRVRLALVASLLGHLGIPAAASAAPAPVYVDKVEVVERDGTGSDKLNDPARLRSVVTIGPGDELDPAKLDATSEALRDMYEAAGYALVSVVTVTGSIVVLDGVSSSPGVDVRFSIRRGPKCRITAIEIDGVAPSAAQRARRSLSLRAGDRYTRRLGAAAARQLAKRFGADVDVAYDALDPDRPWALTVTFTVQ